MELRDDCFGIYNYAGALIARETAQKAFNVFN